MAMSSKSPSHDDDAAELKVTCTYRRARGGEGVRGERERGWPREGAELSCRGRRRWEKWMSCSRNNP